MQPTHCNRVHNAKLQPSPSRHLDHVAVEETVIRLNDEQYWPYPAVDTESNELLYAEFEPATNKAIADSFFQKLSEKHDISDAMFLAAGDVSLSYACHRYGLDFRYQYHENRSSAEHIFRKTK